MKQRQLVLEPQARQVLEHLRDTHPIPYVRERATALLKIAAGQSVHQVAQGGLLKRRKPDTVYAWLNAYQGAGRAGLFQKPRRQRQFSP
jgi:hypothetical protein